jgi:hypothetical protein
LLKTCFWWAALFSAAIGPFFSVRALALEAAEPSFSANCIELSIDYLVAAKLSNLKTCPAAVLKLPNYSIS